jgi:hypothetical protein
VIAKLLAIGIEPVVVDVGEPGNAALLRRMQTESGAVSVPVLEAGTSWYVGYDRIYTYIKGIKHGN